MALGILNCAIPQREESLRVSLIHSLFGVTFHHLLSAPVCSDCIISTLRTALLSFKKAHVNMIYHLTGVHIELYRKITLIMTEKAN